MSRVYLQEKLIMLSQKNAKLWAYSLFCLCLFFVQTTAFAQDRTVTGTITTEEGSGLPGATIVVKGTSIGAVTDASGNFSINVPGSDAVLIISSIGYVTQEIAVGSQTVISITLNTDIEALGEVIVTGYTIDERREATGAVSTVDKAALTAVPSGDVEQQLQGRVPGVVVITNGQPGTTSKIRIRGFGSFLNNQPLYVVDGVPTFSTNFLNPDDIVNTTVLKDATTTSIYGARAANGVVVYTTRQGKKEARKLTVTYDGLVGFTTPGEGFQQLNPQGQADWTWRAIQNAGQTIGSNEGDFSHPQYGSDPNGPVLPDFLLVGSQAGVFGSVDLADEATRYNVTEFDNPNRPIYQVIRANQEGTDWYDAISQTGVITRHTLGLSGGGVGNRFYVGFSAQEQEGTVILQNFRRYALRLNAEFDLGKKFSVGVNMQGTYRELRNIVGGGGGSGSSDDENEVNLAYRMSPIIPVFDEFGGYAGTTAPGFNNPRNPVAQIEGRQNDRFFAPSLFGNMFFTFTPVEGLTLRTSAGINYIQQRGWNYTRRQYENSENNTSFGFGEFSNYNLGWTWTNTANYKKDFGQHGIDILAGFEMLDEGSGRGLGGSGINPFSQDVNFVTLSTVNNPLANGFIARGATFAGVFGRINYTFADKYLLSFVVRRDGSSRFAEVNRTGTFPAISAGYRISEDLFQNVTWVNDLKIRGGYGVVGNANAVANDNQFTLFGTSLANSFYDIAGTNSSAQEGFFRTRIGNAQAKWESAATANIGLDGSFFGDRLTVQVDFWQRNTEDLLFQLPVTLQTGNFAQAPFVNIAEMRNRGVDIQLIGRGEINAFSWEVTVNLGLLDNEIVSFAPGIEEAPGVANPNFRGINPILNQVGRPLSSFFGYEVEGLFRDQADVDAHATQEGAGPGRFKFRDLDGDGEITPDDRTYLGDPIPNVTSGFTIKLGYETPELGKFSLETYMYLQTGNEIFNVSKLFTDFYPLFPGAAISQRVTDSWTPDNLGAEIPIFENVANFSTIGQANSFYVENGSYFRMQNITLAYEMPQAILDKLGMTRIRIFAAANNLFTISGYDGLDPAVGGDADTAFGIDRGNFPIRKSYTFGVNLAF